MIASRRHDLRDKPEELEIRRHDTHHPVGRAIELDRLPDERRVRPEPGFPELVADHRDLVAAWLLLLGSEGPADRGLDPQEVEHIRGHLHPANRFGLVATGQVEATRSHCRQFVERPAALTPIHEVRRRDERPIVRLGGDGLEKTHEPLRLNRQRPKHERADQAEDRRVTGNGEGQRHDGHEGHEPVLEQHATGETDILYQAVHGVLQRSLVG